MKLAWLVIALIGLAAVAQAEPDRTPLKDNHPTRAASMAPLGPLPASTSLALEMVFKPRNRQALDELTANQQNPASPEYHHWLSSAEYNRRFGPDPAQFEAVRAWLASQGFQIVSARPADHYIKFSAPAAAVERTFGVQLMSYPGGLFANDRDPLIPARFADAIGRISGLDNFMRAVPVGPARTD